MAQYGYSIADDHIIAYVNAIAVSEVQPHLMPDVYIPAHLTTQSAPDSRSESFLIEWLEYVRLIGIVEDDSSV